MRLCRFPRLIWAFRKKQSGGFNETDWSLWHRKSLEVYVASGTIRCACAVLREKYARLHFTWVRPRIKFSSKRILCARTGWAFEWNHIGKAVKSWFSLSSTKPLRLCMVGRCELPRHLESFTYEVALELANTKASRFAGGISVFCWFIHYAGSILFLPQKHFCFTKG